MTRIPQNRAMLRPLPCCCPINSRQCSAVNDCLLIVRQHDSHAAQAEDGVDGTLTNVLLNLVPGDWQQRVLGELNPKLVTIYNMLRDRVPELTDRLRLIPYQEESFKAAYERDVERKLEQPVDGAEGLDTAVDFLVRMRMSRGGLGTAFAWSDRLRGGQPGDMK